VVLVYILAGVVILTALSIAGVYIERQQKRRFEREELARLLAQRPPADNGAKPQPEPLRSELVADDGQLAAHVGSNKDGVVSWRPLALPNPHLLIVGGSGSGKSQTIKAIAHDLRKATALVVLDVHGDLTLDGATTHELHFESQYGINPLVLSLDPKGGGPVAQKEIVRTRLQRTFAPMGSVQLGVLDDLLHRCYETRGIIQEDQASWRREPPTFADLEELLDEEIADKKNPERLQALKTKISPVFDCKVFSKTALPIAAKGVTRIDMSRLGLDIQFLASDVLLRQLFREAMLAGEAAEKELRYLFVIDEAKLLVSRGKDDPLGIINRLATEARKYGVGLLLASQDLEHFSRDILNNVATKLVLMHSETAIRATASKLLLEKEQLQALKEPFVGLVKFGGGGWRRVKVEPYFMRV
jgi:energy-coupling factor transporter ATP-binding protein EcfA2